jgi:membrane-associated phospholipid phosphatase
MFISTFPVKHRVRNDGTGEVRLIRTYDEVTCLGWKGSGVRAKTAHGFGIAAVVLACLIGLSRLYLGMHYPSDVICGLLLGMICATIVHSAVKKAEAKRGIIGG